MRTKMKHNLINDGHCFETILPKFCHFFNESLLVDICLVCSNGNVWTYRLLLASISTYLKDLLLSDTDCSAIYLPDVETEDVMLLHQCLFTPELEDGPVQKLAHLFNLLEIQLQPYCDPQRTDSNSGGTLKIVNKALHKCFICSKTYSNHMSYLKHTQVHKDEEQIDTINENIDDEQQTEGDNGVATSSTSRRPKRRTIRSKKFENSVTIDDVTGDSEFYCDVCREQFSFKDELDRHLVDHDEAAELSTDPIRDVSAKNIRRKKRQKVLEFLCGICQKTFSSKQAQTNHLLLHKDERKFCCQICQKKFVAAGALHNHKKLLHRSDDAESKISSCKFCPKTFNNTSNFNRHMRALHFQFSDGKKFSCDVCEKEFKDPSALSAHVKIHSAIKPHQCKHCARKFTTGAQLRVHMRIHEGIRPYSCSECDDRSFTTKGQLNSHIMHRHVGVKLSKNHLCTDCGASFVKSHDLSVHMHRHTGEMPFKCEQCDKGFRSLRNLKNHVRIHTGEKPYRCETCGKSFSTTGGLRQHFVTKASCRVNASEGAYSIKRQLQQVELLQMDEYQQLNNQVHQEEDLQTVVLMSQEGDSQIEGHANIISMADAASLAARGYTFVQIPGDVQHADGQTIVLQAHVQNS